MSKKLIFLIGGLAAFMILVRFDDGRLGLNDVVQTLEIEVAEEEVVLLAENYYKVTGEGVDIEAGEVETFVILARNSTMIGRGNIVSAQWGFETDFGKVEPDFDFIKNLGVNSSVRAFYGETGLLDFMPTIARDFPGAKVVPLLIKDLASEEELDLLVDKLKGMGNIHILKSPTLITASDFHREIRGENNTSYVMNFFWDRQESEGLSVLAFGDMMLGRYVRTLMDRNGMDYIFSGMPEGFFEGPDIVHANLEGPINGKGRSGGTSMVFSFNEDVAPFLKKWGFNLVSLANNHALDQGWEGRVTTVSALEEAGVDWCGHPTEPASVQYGSGGGYSYAFVCLQDVTNKLDDEAANALIASIDADFVFVSIHWGYEYKHKASDAVQVERARAFVDSGAAFVIGHHPHVVQNFEIYKGAPIFYSLGNFVFDQYWSQETQEELALGIIGDDEGWRIWLFPMKSERSVSRLMNAEEKSEWIEKFIGYGEYSAEMQEMIRSELIYVD